MSCEGDGHSLSGACLDRKFIAARELKRRAPETNDVHSERPEILGGFGHGGTIYVHVDTMLVFEGLAYIFLGLVMKFPQSLHAGRLDTTGCYRHQVFAILHDL